MTEKNIERNYNKFYKDINFERAGLFKFISKSFKIEKALYPGCSIHITPSFYFPHVVYVDKSELSKNFFSDIPSLLHFISKSKEYKRSTYLEYVYNDYNKQIEIKENNFDLLLSIFSNSVVSAFKKYIKRGGIILANNFNGEIHEIFQDKDISAMQKIYKKHGTYVIEECRILNKSDVTHKKNIIRKNCGIEYKETDVYYIFRKI